MYLSLLIHPVLRASSGEILYGISVGKRTTVHSKLLTLINAVKIENTCISVAFVDDA